MDAMTTSSKTPRQFVKKLAADYPQFKFKPGSQEHWSPRTKTITYEDRDPANKLEYGLLHELAHALLGHDSYKSDFELLKLEAQAWQTAAEIGRQYGIKIDDDHIQNCLDTYRDWLHRRSKCPSCGVHVMQKDSTTYKCFNCGDSWQVSAGRFARSYRRRS
jgi:predicted RNA-binding Zn-ribbon protein involved in translation (DUF1610 family)